MPGEKANSIRLFKAILVTGFLVGTLDALAAILNFIIPSFRNPVRIFQFIASGVFGREAAFADAWYMPFMGLVFHFFIAIFWTAIFFVLYPSITVVGRKPILTGLLYGIVIWVAMNLVVLPLSRVPSIPFKMSQASIGISILMLVVGLPISLKAHRFYSRQTAPSSQTGNSNR